MPIHFACPACDKVSKVPDAFAGRKGKCPGCQAVILVPDPNEGEPHAAPPSAPEQAVGGPVDGTRIGGTRIGGSRIGGSRIGGPQAGGARARSTAPPPGASGYIDAREPAGETRSCPYCGEEIKRAAKKCRHCGEFLDRRLGKTVRQQQLDPPFSGKAIAGLVVAFLCPLIGLILSLSALSDCRAGKTKGSGVAIAGIVFSGLNFVLGMLIQMNQ